MAADWKQKSVSFLSGWLWIHYLLIGSLTALMMDLKVSNASDRDDIRNVYKSEQYVQYPAASWEMLASCQMTRESGQVQTLWLDILVWALLIAQTFDKKDFHFHLVFTSFYLRFWFILMPKYVIHLISQWIQCSEYIYI